MMERPIIDTTDTHTCTSESVSQSEVVAWVLVGILTVLFTGLLSVVLLWMFKKRQASEGRQTKMSDMCMYIYTAYMEF